MRDRLEQVAKDLYVPISVVGEHQSPQANIYKVKPERRILQSGKLGRLTRFRTLQNRMEDIAATMEIGNIRVSRDGPIYIEIPRQDPEIVWWEDVRHHADGLVMTLGLDMHGEPLTLDLASAPHLLIAGATGSGKSVQINTILTNLMIQNTPSTLGLALVDLKRVELGQYKRSPYLISPVVSTVEGTEKLLADVLGIVEQRYQEMERHGVQNAKAIGLKPIVVVIDEFADLVLQSGYSINQNIIRIAQIGRAASVHLIIATQRPSADVVDGLIKANFPTRIAFAVADGNNSRIILDQAGAEALVGKGDGLLLKGGKVTRFKGAMLRNPPEIVKEKTSRKREGKSWKFWVNYVLICVVVTCLALFILGGLFTL